LASRVTTQRTIAFSQKQDTMPTNISGARTSQGRLETGAKSTKPSRLLQEWCSVYVLAKTLRKIGVSNYEKKAGLFPRNSIKKEEPNSREKQYDSSSLFSLQYDAVFTYASSARH